MEELHNQVWALNTARGGSKSIPLKNLAPLAGRPLMDYCICAVKQSPGVDRIWCTTDHDKISSFCHNHGGIEVQSRPSKLSSDNTSSLDVILYFLHTIKEQFGSPPGYLLLLEPTSPFIQPDQIEQAIAMIKADPLADSVQSVALPPPNHHAYNQRELHKDGLASFRFTNERKGLVNKQSKPDFYVHGNLRVMRCNSVLENGDILGDRSLAIIVPRVHAFDADGPEDFQWAEALISAGLIETYK